MKVALRCLCVLGCLSLTGCAEADRPHSPQEQGDYRSVVDREVATTIREFMAGFSAATCDDVTAVSRFIRDGMIFVNESDVFTVSLADYEQGLRDRVCDWKSHAGVVDSITVDALSRDVAVAAWRYHDEVRLDSGELQRYKGSTLMTLVRSGDGWKISSTMSALE